MKRSLSRSLVRAAVGGVLALSMADSTQAADIVRHSLGPNNNFPIARAVQVPAGKTIYFHSGTTPAPLDPKATPGSLEYWGDTKTQALSVFARLKDSLTDLGLEFKD